ncbi:uncharacterized protein BO80DRAFT_36335 [Aspergillus ibericus CBS 121593]|uniref:Secreted protein n=1 Tax=Aspergillus ibericus CBS 121593 TaxID=1448316 RepID=A0A395H3J9_9EURO|nr:hypothetical protein BO80DRAFT_36335 [Aspergillus ibericus CBS 121593]RAL02477.1 hypothetical protein BO80DRAFT_36335 [Aspergillus ibericus CBS 121593]
MISPKHLKNLHFALATLLVVAITRAPTALPNCTAKRLTPPPVPCVSNHCSAKSRFPGSPKSAFHAVSPAQLSVEASTKLSPLGIRTRPCSLNAAMERNVPSREPPRPDLAVISSFAPARRCCWMIGHDVVAGLEAGDFAADG